VPGRAPLVALALALLALAACGGKEQGEDAPALLGTGIPAAAPNASGVELDPPPAAPAGTGARLPAPGDDDPPPADPFAAPDPPASPAPPHPVAPVTPPSKGMQL
jgi:hypothetical protein